MFKNKVLYILYRLFSGLKPVNFFVSSAYKLLLIPTLSSILKMRHPYLLEIIPRNSLISNKNFEALLSDIDLTLVVGEGADCDKLIQDFVRVKKVLPMLDMPEIYSFSENEQLQFFKKQPYWGLIGCLYKIRKISWSLESIKKNASSINKIKQARAIDICFETIFKKDPKPTGQYTLSDFKYLNKA